MGNKVDNMFLVTLKLGFCERTIGTKMLRSAAAYAAALPEEERVFVTKDVYPYVAKLYGVSAMAAERNMRYAIKRAGRCMTVGEAIALLCNVCREVSE